MTIKLKYDNEVVTYTVRRTWKNKKGKVFAECDKTAQGVTTRIDGIDLDALMKSRFAEKT